MRARAKSKIATTRYKGIESLCLKLNQIRCTFILNRYELNDPEIMTYIDLRNTVMYQVGNGQPADYLPILKYIPIPSVLKFKRLLKSFHRFFYDEFNNHRERFDPGKSRKH